MRITIKKSLLAALLLCTSLLAAEPSYAVALYFPHVDTTFGWQTEIAIINTSPDQTVYGTLRGLSNEGQLIDTREIMLSARGRIQITVADEFTNHADIGYIIFDTDSSAVQGYTKFYKQGKYRVAIPAVKEVNTSTIYITHIDSGIQWWTGLSLVNTTSETKNITITFNTGEIRAITLNANEHKPFLISSLFNNQTTPSIQSAVITNASGIIGLEVFGTYDDKQLEGILLTDKTASTLYYPYVAGGDWWTGIVAYNPSESSCTVTITPYNSQGTVLSSSSLSIPGKSKYVGFITNLGLPAQTAWFKIDSTSPLSGFELIGTNDYEQLAAYAGNGGTGAKAGILPKIEKSGWTSITFVNTEASAASVTLTAYTDDGTAVDSTVLTIGSHAKVVNNPELIFSQNISGATYIAYSSDRNVMGFQLNGSSDNTMLDGLPALGIDGGGNAPGEWFESWKRAPLGQLPADGTFFMSDSGKWNDFTPFTCNDISILQGDQLKLYAQAFAGVSLCAWGQSYSHVIQGHGPDRIPNYYLITKNTTFTGNWHFTTSINNNGVLPYDIEGIIQILIPTTEFYLYYIHQDSPSTKNDVGFCSNSLLPFKITCIPISGNFERNIYDDLVTLYGEDFVKWYQDSSSTFHFAGITILNGAYIDMCKDNDYRSPYYPLCKFSVNATLTVDDLKMWEKNKGQ